MRQTFWTALIASGCAAPLFKCPPYAACVFVIVIFWNHLFPSEQSSPEVLLLPTKLPYLAALKPLEDPTAVIGDHCPTCWEELSKDNQPTKLACGHVYCNPCILEWIDSGKNHCPICKNVLFQQPLFTGNEAIAQKVHKLRICLVALSLLITVLRQPLAFIACNPAKWKHMHWTWTYLNPLSYLTGYGSIPKTISAVVIISLDILQLGSARYGVKVYGPAWFRLFPGHWGWWVWGLYSAANNCRSEIEGHGVRHYAWVAWRILLWRLKGSPGSFLMWGAEVVWSIPASGMGVVEAAKDIAVEITAAWDKDGKQIV